MSRFQNHYSPKFYHSQKQDALVGHFGDKSDTGDEYSLRANRHPKAGNYSVRGHVCVESHIFPQYHNHSPQLRIFPSGIILSAVGTLYLRSVVSFVHIHMPNSLEQKWLVVRAIQQFWDLSALAIREKNAFLMQLETGVRGDLGSK